MGLSAVHETGHFFGLLHTFGSNSCDEEHGDLVLDTPTENGPQTECNHDRDSCPRNAGLDPSWSFMDYTPDRCMMRFSRGQVSRMRSMILVHKPLLLARTTVSISTATTVRLPTTVPPRRCTDITCGYLCTGECGWSKSRNECRFGGRTTQQEMRLGTGCTTVAAVVRSPISETTTRATRKFCKAIRCSRDCVGQCGWSRPKAKCTLGGRTTKREANEAIGCDRSDNGVVNLAADRNIAPPWRGCMSLGWRVIEQLGACGASQINGTCHVANSGYAQAAKICSSIGARLCTRMEIDGGVGRSTGCGMNSERVWSSTRCATHDGSAGVLVGPGKPEQDTVVCEPVVGRQRLSVRCCASVVGEAAPLQDIAEIDTSTNSGGGSRDAHNAWDAQAISIAILGCCVGLLTVGIASRYGGHMWCQNVYPGSDAIRMAESEEPDFATYRRPAADRDDTSSFGSRSSSLGSPDVHTMADTPVGTTALNVRSSTATSAGSAEMYFDQLHPECSTKIQSVIDQDNTNNGS